MHLMVEFPGNGVVPRERFGPIPQLFMRTATEERGTTHGPWAGGVRSSASQSTSR